MPLYMLSRPGMAPGIGLVVREKTEFHARHTARQYARNSTSEAVRKQADHWLDKETRCTLLDNHGEEGVIGAGKDSEWKQDEKEGGSNAARAWAARYGTITDSPGTPRTP